MSNCVKVLNSLKPVYVKAKVTFETKFGTVRLINLATFDSTLKSSKHRSRIFKTEFKIDLVLFYNTLTIQYFNSHPIQVRNPCFEQHTLVVITFWVDLEF